MKYSFIPFAITLFTTCQFTATLLADTLIQTEVQTLIQDDFSQAEFKPRTLSKGNWTIAGGVASAVHEPEENGKMKKHGPQATYATGFTDGTISFDVKCSKCKAFAVAVDSTKPDKAYHLRLKLKGQNKVGQPALINTYEPKVEGARKAVSIKLLEEGIPELNEGEWNHVEIKFVGNQATSTVNGIANTVSHQRISLPKRVTKIELQTGEISIRKFSLTIPKQESE